MYTRYETQYLDNLRAIVENGAREVNQRTGVATRRLPFSIMQIDVSRELPILTSKTVAWQKAIDELVWIYLKGSNDVSELHCHIWDKYAYDDGTIGKSYGYQVGKRVITAHGEYPNQLTYIIETLRRDPSSRQAVMNLWAADELHEMSLPPCLLSSCWTVINGKLNCLLTQRSGDYPLGVPFDTFEYGVLMLLIARELGIQPGILTHVISDSHVYENQIEPVTEWLDSATVYPATAKLVIADKPLSELVYTDFTVEDYQSGKRIKFELN